MPSSEAALRPPTQKHVYVGRPQGSSKTTTRPRPLSRARTSGLTRLQTPVPFPPRGFRLKTRTHTYNKRGLRCGQDLAPAAARGPHDVRRRLQQRGSQVLERFRVRRGGEGEGLRGGRGAGERPPKRVGWRAPSGAVRNGGPAGKAPLPARSGVRGRQGARPRPGRPGRGARGARRGVLLLRLVLRGERRPSTVFWRQARDHQGGELREARGVQRAAGPWDGDQRDQAPPDQVRDHPEHQQGPVGAGLERADQHRGHDPRRAGRSQGGGVHGGLPPAGGHVDCLRVGGPHHQDLGPLGPPGLGGLELQVVRRQGPARLIPNGVHPDPNLLHRAAR